MPLEQGRVRHAPSIVAALTATVRGCASRGRPGLTIDARPTRRASIGATPRSRPTGSRCRRTPLAGEHDARAVVAQPGRARAAARPRARARARPRGRRRRDERRARASASYVGERVRRHAAAADRRRPRRSSGCARRARSSRPIRASRFGSRSRYAHRARRARRPRRRVAPLHRRRPARRASTRSTSGCRRGWGNHLAFGASAARPRDRADVGGAPVQRRYELEARASGRSAPTRLELAVGGRLGETRARRRRLGARRPCARARGAVRASRSVETPRAPRARSTRRPARSTTTAASCARRSASSCRSAASASRRYGTGVRDDTGDDHALGGTLVARVVGGRRRRRCSATADHIERVELTGDDRHARAHRARRAAARDRARSDRRRASSSCSTASTRRLGHARRSCATSSLAVQARRQEGVRVHGRRAPAATTSSRRAADKIYIDPAGGLRLVGMAGTSLYFRGAFDHARRVAAVREDRRVQERARAVHRDRADATIAAQMHDELFDSLWEQWLAAVAAGAPALDASERAARSSTPARTPRASSRRTRSSSTRSRRPTRSRELIAAELGGVVPGRARRRRAARALAAPGDRGDLRRRRHHRRRRRSRSRCSARSSPAARRSSTAIAARARRSARSARSSCASTRPAAARSPRS